MNPHDCLFCRIASEEVPATKVFTDEQIIAFEDVNPQAPTHLLIIPRKHIATLNELTADDDALLGRMHRVAAQIAGERGWADRGYRVVINCNEEAGQTVFHVHMHLLAGRPLQWPPG